MDELLVGKCTSPNMAYQFVSELTRSYDKLKQNYKQNDVFLEVQHIYNAIFRSVNHFKVWLETCEVELSCWKIGRIPEFSLKMG